eukprot:TRINITY_DN47019_c0_g1_i1.p2 TRINITY_DN47019_c0_g1~~TRINITY_DN47019_c0_g1_i1.p2  ORF type:complete len:185 (+),score=16.26 TRINITY_DN47019_c0_g1_i1:89-643(+)
MLRQAALGAAAGGGVWLYATTVGADSGRERPRRKPSPGGDGGQSLPPPPAPAPEASGSWGLPMVAVCIVGGIAVAAFFRGDDVQRLFRRLRDAVLDKQGPFGDLAARSQARVQAEVSSGRAAALGLCLAGAVGSALLVAQLVRRDAQRGDRLATLCTAAWAGCGCWGWRRELSRVLQPLRVKAR